MRAMEVKYMEHTNASTTRIGKIARLPLAVREELNTRLRNGESGRKLVPWLNGLPAAREVLAAECKGAPITECIRQNHFIVKKIWQGNDWQRNEDRGKNESSASGKGVLHVPGSCLCLIPLPNIPLSNPACAAHRLASSIWLRLGALCPVQFLVLTRGGVFAPGPGRRRRTRALFDGH